MTCEIYTQNFCVHANMSLSV